MNPQHIPRTAWIVSAAALAVSFFASILALGERASYWPLFWLWACAIALLAGWAIAALAQDCGGWARIRRYLHVHRREIAAVLALTLLALCLRTVALSSVPYPFSTDEPLNAYKTHIILSGEQKNMFTYASLGHPALVPFLTAWLHRVFPAELAQRLPSAFLGTLFVPLLYLLLRAVLDKRIAFAGAAYAATYHLHVHYSRIGINNIQSATLAALAVYCTWLALERKHPAYFVLAGLSTALSWYAYVGTRLVVLIVLGMIAYAALTRAISLRKHAPAFALFALACATVILPLVMRLPGHPAEFVPRPHMLMFAHPAAPVLASIPARVIESFMLFVSVPEQRWEFYNAPIPFVDGLSLMPFLIGLIGSVVAFRQRRAGVLLLLFFVPLVFMGGFTQDPYSGRFLIAILAVCAWVALGTARITQFLRLPRPSFALLIAVLCAVNVLFYFAIYAPSEHYGGGPVHAQAQLLDHVRTLPNTTIVFSYGWPRTSITNADLRLALRDYPVFEVRTNGTIATIGRRDYPASSARTFLFFVGLRDDELPVLQSRCPGGTLFSFVNDDNLTVAHAYTFLTNSTCKPIVLARNVQPVG